ncbi:MAG: porin family protein [Fermentimonas sp.]|jgi:hypothetical protein
MKKLKLLFLITVVACMAVPATAQISFAGKGGVNLTNFYGEDTEDLTPKIGFNAGVASEYNFANNFCLQSGLMLHSKGTKTKRINGWKTYTMIYLQLPVHAGYKVDITPATKIVFHAGPYIAYGIIGKEQYMESTTNLFEDLHYQRFDAGAGMGVGAEFAHFLLDLGVDMGFLSFTETCKNLSSYLSVGYRF